jgi:hypothetical protein
MLIGKIPALILRVLQRSRRSFAPLRQILPSRAMRSWSCTHLLRIDIKIAQLGLFAHHRHISAYTGWLAHIRALGKQCDYAIKLQMQAENGIRSLCVIFQLRPDEIVSLVTLDLWEFEIYTCCDSRDS